MRVLLLCLLQVLAKASWADMPAARVNGVEIETMRLERYFSEYLDAQGRAVATGHGHLGDGLSGTPARPPGLESRTTNRRRRP